MSRDHSKKAGKNDDRGVVLGDRLDARVADKLKELRKQTEKEWLERKKEQKAREEFERKQREKNKTFEELLNESNLDWKNFK